MMVPTFFHELPLVQAVSTVNSRQQDSRHCCKLSALLAIKEELRYIGLQPYIGPISVIDLLH